MIKQRGITLIALVITIIVMLILAGVSLNVLVGDNGVLTKAQDAKKEYQAAEEKEQVDMAIAGAQMNTYPKIDYETLKNNIKEVFGDDASVSKMENDSTGFIDYVITVPSGRTYTTSSNLKVLDIFIEENKQPNEKGIGVSGYMIELDQKIGLRYYFTMPEDIRNTGAKIKFSKNNVVIQEIPVDNAYSAIIDGNSYYYVTNYCVAKEMANDITFCMYNASDVAISDTYTYSIKSYGNAVISNEENYVTETKKNQVEYIKALLYYGGMSQIYLANKTNDSSIAANLASEGINVDTSYITKEYFNGYSGGLIGTSKISYFGNPRINLGDEITIKMALSAELTSDKKEEEKIVGARINGEEKIYNFSEVWNNDVNKYVYCIDIPVKITEFDRMYEIYLVDVDNNVVGQGARYGMYVYLQNMLDRQLSPDDANYTNSELFKDVARAMAHLSECGKKIF